MEVFRKEYAINWIENGLRHSFGTYFFALTENEYEVAKQMGNSPDVMKSHYANQLITKETAKEYFEIAPSNDAKVMDGKIFLKEAK